MLRYSQHSETTSRPFRNDQQGEDRCFQQDFLEALARAPALAQALAKALAQALALALACNFHTTKSNHSMHGHSLGVKLQSCRVQWMRQT